MKLCAFVFRLSGRGAVKAQKGFGKTLRRLIAVLISGIDDGDICHLELLRRKGKAAVPKVFVGGDPGDEAEGAVEVIVGHVDAFCYVSVVDVLVNVFFHVADRLLDQLD